MAKITMATVKSFIRKNTDNLFIKKIHAFDGMCDGISERTACPFTQVEHTDRMNDHQLGITGAWFTFGGNLLTAYEDDTFKGFDVYNCCGHFVIAIKK